MTSVLHVDLDVAAGRGDDLRATFAADFHPAVSAQPGFAACELLAPAEGDRWRLVIRFDTEEQRLAWVETPAHQKVWPLVAALTTAFQPVLFVAAGGEA